MTQLSLFPEDNIEAEPLVKKLGLDVNLIEDEHEARSILDFMGFMGLDIETYPAPGFERDPEGGLVPRKSKIRLIQVYYGNKHVAIFDYKNNPELVPKELWDRELIAHNAIFEMKHLMSWGITPKNLDCTLLADRLINGKRLELKKSLGLSTSAGLKDLAKEYLGMDISKEMQTSDWSKEKLTQKQLDYAALDAYLPVEIFNKQLRELTGKGLYKSYCLMKEAQQVVASMELAGIGFDVDRHKLLMGKWAYEKDKVLAEIDKEIGVNLNLSSSKEMGQWLNDELEQGELKNWAKTDKGSLSTSTPTFKSNINAHKSLPKIIEYRQAVKKLDSFGENLYKFIDPVTHRLHGSFSLGTTWTGRMASSRPNMQNMPRTGFRDLFIARKGYKLIGLDYSQQELRVVAIVSQDKELLEIYRHGGDVHKRTAAAILGIKEDKVTKPDRQLAKAVIFGLLYGQGAKGLSVYAKQQYGVEMSEEEAEKHRTALFKTYKGLRKWQLDTGKEVELTGIVRTKLGRIRDFNREEEGYRFTAALNVPIQGAAAEITLCAMIRVKPLLCDRCQLVNVVHDELLVEVREDCVDYFSVEMQSAMEKGFLDVFPEAKPYMKGLVEAHSGNNWSETK